jgi:hypothetical protein
MQQGNPGAGYVATLHRDSCYTSVLQQSKCSFKFYYTYVISINMTNVITVNIFELIIYAAFNLNCMEINSGNKMQILDL